MTKEHCRAEHLNATTAEFTLLINGEEVGGNTFHFTFFATLLVSDYFSHCVRRFNADTGEYIDQFIKSTSGGLMGPRGIAFGVDGNFYVACDYTDSVLQYHGSTGNFLRVFAKLSGQPRAIVFHYLDLYVAVRQGKDDTRAHVYRFNARTGSARGQYLVGGEQCLRNPWGIVFDHFTNTTFITSEDTGNVCAYRQPSSGIGLAPGQQAHFDRIWSSVRVLSASGIVFTVDSVYVTGPFAGNSFIRFDRTTGAFMHQFEDEDLTAPMDVKEYNDYIYVCSNNAVRKYNRLNGEFIRQHASFQTMAASFMIFHKDWRLNMGE